MRAASDNDFILMHGGQPLQWQPLLATQGDGKAFESMAARFSSMCTSESFFIFFFYILKIAANCRKKAHSLFMPVLAP